jgi:hypothetical protein
MANMSMQARQRIIDAAKRAGFLIQVKSDGSDLYDRNLVFESQSYCSRVFIHKVTGVTKASGDFTYLKVAVKPSAFREDLVSPRLGIEDFINQQSKANRHHSSNYQGFPADIPGKAEPYGKCYKVFSLDALSTLLAGLVGRKA